MYTLEEVIAIDILETKKRRIDLRFSQRERSDGSN